MQDIWDKQNGSTCKILELQGKPVFILYLSKHDIKLVNLILGIKYSFHNPDGLCRGSYMYTNRLDQYCYGCQIGVSVSKPPPSPPTRATLSLTRISHNYMYVISVSIYLYSVSNTWFCQLDSGFCCGTRNMHTVEKYMSSVFTQHISVVTIFAKYLA